MVQLEYNTVKTLLWSPFTLKKTKGLHDSTYRTPPHSINCPEKSASNFFDPASSPFLNAFLVYQKSKKKTSVDVICLVYLRKVNLLYHQIVTRLVNWKKKLPKLFYLQVPPESNIIVFTSI